jgi:hypothetical protein
MDSSRVCRGFLVLGLFFAVSSWLLADEARKYALIAAHTPGELVRVEIALEIGGDFKLVNEGATKQLPMSVVAALKYDERLLGLDPAGLPSRSVRYYDEARASIKVDKGGEQPKLNENRRLIAVEKPEGQPAVLYCPGEPLRREEVDLIDVPGNSLLVDRLLPTEPVAPGQKWKLSDETLTNLLGLDAVSWSDVDSMLTTMPDGTTAEMLGGGSISGAVGGVSTEIELKIKYRFDMNRKRIYYLAMLVKEKRSVGHIGPGLDTVAKTIIKMTPLSTSQQLSETTNIPKLSTELAQLGFESASAQFRFGYERRWYVTSDEPRLAVLRLLDRGELVAQCNISSLPSVKSPPTLAEFQQDVQNSLGKNFGQFTNASQSTNDAGYTVLRVVAHGAVSDLPIEWVYYLVANPKGQRVSLAFTYEQNLTERFAQADRMLVNQLRLTEPPAPTTARLPKK